MCMCVLFTLTDLVSTIANPVCGLLDRKISEGYLQSSNESMETRTKTTKERNSNTTHIPEKTEEWHSIERVWNTASRELSHPIPPPDRNS